MPALFAEAHRPMPVIDPLVHRVARRHVARVQAERVGREVQRRRDGLVTVGEYEDGEDGSGTDAPRARRLQPSSIAK